MSDPTSVARRQNVLQTLVLVGILMTPAWFAPDAVRLPWMALGLLLGVPAVLLAWRSSPWLPTPADELPRLLAALELRPGERFCDLGAGDARLLVRVARATGARALGVELSPLPYLLGRLRVAWSGVRGVELRLGDLYDVELSAQDAVYVWGTAYLVGTERFSAWVRRGLRPGARLVSYEQPVHGLEPARVDTAGRRPIFVYRLPGLEDGGPSGAPTLRTSFTHPEAER